MKRENMSAREPSEVQSDTYAEIAAWRVAEPPRMPSTIDANRRNL